MKHKLLCMLAVLSLAFAAVGAGAYTGSLSSTASEMDGTGFWIDEGSTIAWTVTPMAGYWNYDYTLTVPRAEISHFIIEVSENFTSNDFWDVQVMQGGVSSTELNWFTAPPVGDPDQQPNPFLPADIYGIKFDGTSGTTLQVNFNSSRMPTWGDFYAKCGNAGGNSEHYLEPGVCGCRPDRPRRQRLSGLPYIGAGYRSPRTGVDAGVGSGIGGIDNQAKKSITNALFMRQRPGNHLGLSQLTIGYGY
jgi:hypothetical protein